MSRWIWLSLLAPGVAGAVSPTWYAKGASEVEIGGRKSIALYAGPDGRPFVLGAFGEGEDRREIPVYLGLTGPITVPGSLVDALGLKARGEGDGAAVTLPEVRLGEVVLRDVRAQVGPEAVLNLALLDEIATFVRPSSGAVEMAPVAEADALLGDAATVTAGVEGAAPWWYHGSKRAGDALSWQVPGQIGESTGVFRVATHRAGSTLGGEVPGGAPLSRGGVSYAWTAAQVGGASAREVLWRRDASLVGRQGDLLGTLGADALSGLDWAVDPSTSRFAIREGAGAWADPSEPLVAAARADFARAEAEAEEAKKEEAPEEPVDPTAPPEDAAAVGRHTALAEALWAWGSHEEALDHYRAASAASGERCGPKLTLGRRLLENGEAGAALSPLQEAATLWDRWIAQDLETRARVEAGQKVADDVFDVPQDGGCHEAWGDLAAARFEQGAYDEVRAIARTHRDLDPRPWQIAGMAGLVQGDPTAANADLRQALQLGARQDAWTHVALGWASAGLGRTEAVEAQLDALKTTPDLDLVAAWSAKELALEALGATAVEWAAALAAARPDSAPAWLALAWTQAAIGQDPAAARDEARRLAEAAAARRPGDDGALGAVAAEQALRGAIADGHATLARGLPLTTADGWLASALLSQAALDEEGAGATLHALVARYPTAPIPIGWASPAVGDAP